MRMRVVKGLWMREEIEMKIDVVVVVGIVIIVLVLVEGWTKH